jgi:hypothetical protein
VQDGIVQPMGSPCKTSTHLGFNRMDATHTKDLSEDGDKPALELPSDIKIIPDIFHGHMLDEIESTRYRVRTFLIRGFKKVLRTLAN